jgi:RNA polymerase sigma-70 factor (ECF subfamily)
VTEPLDDEAARALRALWFRYLDTIEPIRPRLYRYCQKLTGSIFDAEDLLQETLLKGFGSIGSGVFVNQPAPDARAYLCRIATNAWIDTQRKRMRAERAATMTQAEETTRETPPLTPAAGAALFERASPQERAAVVLKDVFDFSLKEIADLIQTSEGAVKTALHRGREKLGEIATEHAPPRMARASTELLDAFDAAFRARDVAAITSLLLETATYEVQGVGWEMGRKGTWINISLNNFDLDGVRGERRLVEGEWCGCGIYSSGGEDYLVSLVRYEESDGKIARLINYFFCPDTLAAAATQLGLKPPRRDYHQDPETLARMIADMRVPWLQT